MPRILYVTRDISDPYINAIRGQGIDVDVAVRYETAIDKLTNGNPDLVFVESTKVASHESAEAPYKRNTQAGMRIVEMANEMGIPSLVNTGGSKDDVLELMDRGATIVMRKPSGLDLHLMVIMNCLPEAA